MSELKGMLKENPAFIAARKSTEEKHSDRSDSDSEKEDKTPAAKEYDYLLGMPLLNLSHEKVQDLTR